MSETDFRAEPGRREIIISKTYDAPREEVYGAMVDPDTIPRWWGPAELSTTVDHMDVRPGGTWRFAQVDKDGNKYVFNGEYRDVVPPERLSYTFEFEGQPGDVMTETVVLDEQDGMTLVRIVDEFESVEQRDGMLSKGMKEGAVESMERFGLMLTDKARR